jgi:hypothetical protein
MATFPSHEAKKLAVALCADRAKWIPDPKRSVTHIPFAAQPEISEPVVSQMRALVASVGGKPEDLELKCHGKDGWMVGSAILVVSDVLEKIWKLCSAADNHL